MRHNLLILLSLLLLTLGCANSRVSPRLDAAEAIMEQHPDSALTILQQIDGSALSGETRARHALLLSQALDKNYVDVTSDSLISIAVNYYANSDDAYRKMLAYHYSSVIYLNARNYENSLRQALKSYDIALDLNDANYLSRLETIVGMLYNACYSFKVACQWNCLALEHAKIAGRKDWLPNLYAAIGEECYNLQRYEDAITYMDSAAMFTETLDPNVLEIQYISHYALGHGSISDSIYNCIIDAGFQPPLRTLIVHAETHQDEAINGLNNYADQNELSMDAMNADFAYAMAYIRKGDKDSAIEHMGKHILSYNNAIASAYGSVLDNIQHEHDVEIADKEAQSAQTFRTLSFISIPTLSLLITIAVLIIIIQRNRQKTRRIQWERDMLVLQNEYNSIKIRLEGSEAELSEQQCRIALLSNTIHQYYAKNDEQTIINQKEKIQTLNDEITELRKISYTTFLNQFSWIDRFGTTYISATKSAKSTPKKFPEFLSKEVYSLFSDNSFIKTLPSIIANYDETLFNEINSLQLLNSEKEVLFCLLCGLSPAVTAILLKKSTRAIYNLKSRIKDKLQNIQTPGALHILKMLQN